MRKAWAVLAAILAFGCGSGSSSIQGLAWPQPNPRVALERMVATPRDLTSSLLAGITRGEDLLFVRPYGLAWQGEDLLVADPGAGRILRLPLGGRGRVQRSPEGALQEPLFLAVTPEGIAVSDPPAGTVWMFDSNLRPVRRLAEGLNHPTGLAWAAGGLWVAETTAHHLRCLGPACPQPRIVGQRGTRPGEFNYPTALAAHGETLWVADTLNFRVQSLDARTGEPRTTLGSLGDTSGSTPRAKGLAVDREGRIWVSDGLLDQVAIFAPDGTLLLCLDEFFARERLFALPAGVAAQGERVAVADALHRRVVVFKLLPEGQP